MAKKKQEADVVHEADQLTAEEAAAEAEMIEDDEPEVVAVEEASGEEQLSSEVVPEKVEQEETKVSIKALDAERHKRKEVEARTAVLEEQLRRFTAPKPEAPVVDEMPDPVTDIEGFKAWNQRQLEAHAAPVRQMQQNMQVQGAVGSLTQYAQNSEATFKAEKPDYEAALSHAREMKTRELSGFFPPEQVQGELGKVEAMITLLAMQNGKSPAQVVYDYALMTGYKPVDAASNITRLATAQKNTQSTAGAGGTSRPEEYTIESLANMSQEELALVPDDKLAKVLGG